MVAYINKPKALITTIEPIDGGVPTMTFWICELLEKVDIVPILAWYAPWSHNPDLSVPIYSVFFKRPGCRGKIVKDKYEGWGMGAWFPELEFTHYWPSTHWKELVRSCQIHITVSGNALSAIPYVLLDKPFIAWLATPWDADRRDRVRGFGWPRKCLDSFVNRNVILELEKKVLRSPNGKILSLSRYTSREFSEIANKKLDDVLVMPVNDKYFFSDRSKTVRWRIGFAGRYCDPRKNIRLLIQASNLLHNWGSPVELVLVGDSNPSLIDPLIREFNMQHHVTCYSNFSAKELGKLLQTLDIFVIPSFQEGLCISALEAMSCGVPIVSTRCGGPEDYVLSNLTGVLVDSNPEAMGRAIYEICSQKTKRECLSEGAEKWVVENASTQVSSNIFYNQLEALIRKVPASESQCLLL